MIHQSARLLHPEILPRTASNANTASSISSQPVTRQNPRAFSQVLSKLSIDPSLAEAHYKAGNLLNKEGRADEAALRYSAALRARPAYPEAHYQLAMILAAQKHFLNAVEHLKKAVELRPHWLEALNNLAWIMATQSETGVRNGTQAVALARRRASGLG